MANFNTNQTRQLYVASGTKRTSAAAVASNGDIALLKNADGDMYFVYKNGDGIVVRSDMIPAGCIDYVNKKAAADLARPLMAYTVAADTDAMALSALVGKTVRLHITVEQFVSYDPNDSVSIIAELACNSTNTATAQAFHKALAMAIAKALPKKDIPYFKVYSNGTEVTASTAEGSVTGTTYGVVLVPGQQKWILGKQGGEPCSLSIYGTCDGGACIKVSVATVAATNVAQSTSISPVSISGAYEIADLEYFTYGERGDVFRGNNWPNNYEPKYLADVTASYSLLSIQYFWAGKAENIQKSPRTIQIAGSSTIINALYNEIVGSGSGSGGSQSA